MPLLNQIVQLINEGLKVKALSDKRFATGDYNGIAIPVYREKIGGPAGQRQSLPCVYQEGDSAKYVGIDDTMPIIIYHRLLRNTAPPQQAKNQFGDGNRWIKSSATLIMIVYADRSRINLSQDDLEALIISGMIDEIPRAQYPSTGVSSILVTHQETNFSAQSIFAQEYQNVDFFLKPESILFQITYTIGVQYSKSCLSICGC